MVLCSSEQTSEQTSLCIFCRWFKNTEPNPSIKSQNIPEVVYFNKCLKMIWSRRCQSASIFKLKIYNGCTKAPEFSIFCSPLPRQRFHGFHTCSAHIAHLEKGLYNILSSRACSGTFLWDDNWIFPVLLFCAEIILQTFFMRMRKNTALYWTHQFFH